MAAVTVVKAIGSTGDFSTLALWQAGAPADLTTAQKFAAGTFLTATFIQGESLTFTGSGATGKFLDTDSTGAGSGTYLTFGVTAGTPAASDTVSGDSSGATCVLSGSALNTGVVWQGQCQNQEFSGINTIVTISGSTNSATAYKELTTVAGASFRDNVNAQTNALRYNASNGAGIRTVSPTNAVTVSEANFRISKLQLSATADGGRSLGCSQSSLLMDFCICEGAYRGISTTIGVVGISGGTGHNLRNSVFVQGASVGQPDHIIGIGAVGTASFYNDTFVVPTDLNGGTGVATAAIASTASGTVLKNCAFFGLVGTVDPIGTGATVTTSYTDGTDVGANGFTIVPIAGVFQNTVNATRDFRLAPGSALIDVGTTDSTNAAHDIVGTSRPQGAAYDVGCWEYMSASPPAPEWLSHPVGFFHGIGRMGLRG